MKWFKIIGVSILINIVMIICIFVAMLALPIILLLIGAAVIVFFVYLAFEDFDPLDHDPYE